MSKELVFTQTTWWIIGGASIAFASIGGYLWYEKRKKQKSKGKKEFLSSSSYKKPAISVHPSIRQVPNWDNAFDMNYLSDVQKWIAPKSIKVLEASKANQFAKQLKKAKGIINDDEKLIAAFFGKQLQDKTQVSSISMAFWNLYKIDLWLFLKSFLSEKELHRYVTRSVAKLPNYTLQ